jgi:DNA-directed RNA polymerase subunit RPC12/RpoP
MAQLPRLIIDAVLFCPHCGDRHVDEARNGEKWHRRAHTTHRCQDCGRDFDVYVSGQDFEPKNESASAVRVEEIKQWPWFPDDVDKITAALALPKDTPGAVVATAVRQLTRRCEELEHQALAFSEAHTVKT